MAVTLLEAKKNVQDALQMGVIDEFRKSNYLLNALTFDDAVSPTGGGATLSIPKLLANFSIFRLDTPCTYAS